MARQPFAPPRAGDAVRRRDPRPPGREGALRLDCVKVSNRLLEQKVASTTMRGWVGEVADRHVRFVFSNEPVERLALLGRRVHDALAAAGG
jgi:hypothetical protein